MMTRCRICALVGAAALSVASAAHAATVVFDLTTEFSGGQNPTSPGPWGRATFDDGGGTGSVTLTIQSLLAGDASAFATAWYFNYDPALNLAQLNISGGRGAGVDDTIQTGVDAFQAGPDGRYDVLLTFDNSPPANRFNGDESVVFTFTSTQAITANSFNFLSAPAGGHGPFTHVGRLQGTGEDNEGSGWFTGNGNGPIIPLPTTAGLAGISLMSLAVRRRRA